MVGKDLTLLRRLDCRFPHPLFPQIADKQRTMEAKLQHGFFSIFSLDFMWNDQFQTRMITKCWRDKAKRSLQVRGRLAQLWQYK
jgi:hypothetical protein